MNPPRELAVVEDTRGAVRLIRLNRPSVINAVNDDIRRGVRDAVIAAEADAEIRAIVLAGTGSRGFCAGADIKEQRAAEAPVEIRLRLEESGWIEAVAAARKPVIAAVHGICLGAGTELALACDIRVAAPSAVFGLPETSIGLIPGAGGTQRLPRLVGEGRAKHMILTGERVRAEDALRIGLVSSLAASDEVLLDTAAALAARIAEHPPAATRYAKEAIEAARHLPVADGLAIERALFSMLSDTEDRREAARAFIEKRAPCFVGR